MDAHMVSYLPANAPAGTQDSDTLCDYTPLECQIFVKALFFLVALIQIVWRRRNDKSGAAVRYLFQESKAISCHKGDVIIGRVASSKSQFRFHCFPSLVQFELIRIVTADPALSKMRLSRSLIPSLADCRNSSAA